MNPSDYQGNHVSNPYYFTIFGFNSILALAGEEIAPDQVTHVVITNLGVPFCFNIDLFKNAKTFMFNDIALPGCYYASIEQVSRQIILKSWKLQFEIAVFCQHQPGNHCVARLGSDSRFWSTFGTDQKRTRTWSNGAEEIHADRM